MKDSERDTHFQGFSKTVWNEIEPMVNDSGLGESAKQLIAERIQRILAQRAYDLVFYAITCVEKFDFDTYVLAATDEEAFALIHKAIAEMPDMTKLPD